MDASADMQEFYGQWTVEDSQNCVQKIPQNKKVKTSISLDSRLSGRTLRSMLTKVKDTVGYSIN